MASQLIYTFTPTIPAGTAIATPYAEQMSFPQASVDQIELKVPPGSNGAMGFSIGSSGVAIVPFNQPGWIVTDDETITWDVDSQFNSGAWEFFGYNLGVYDHAVYVRFLVSLVVAPSALIVASAIPSGLITSS